MIDFAYFFERDKRDDPKNWISCNRPLSPAEVMYILDDAKRKDSDVGGLREGESPRIRTVRLGCGLPERGKRNVKRRTKAAWLDALS